MGCATGGANGAGPWPSPISDVSIHFSLGYFSTIHLAPQFWTVGAHYKQYYCMYTVKCKISGQYMKFGIYLNSGQCIGISDETKT